MARKISKKSEQAVYLLKLPPEVSIRHIEAHPDYDDISIDVPSPVRRICPRCGSSECVIKNSKSIQTVNHIPYGGRPVRLSYNRCRLRCKSCGNTFFQIPDWILPQLRMTKMLYIRIFHSLTATVSIRRIAIDNGLSESTVHTVLDHIVIPPINTLPKTLCLDEYRGNSGWWNPKRSKWDVNKFHCIVVDGDNGAIVEVLPQRDLAYLKKYFSQFHLETRRGVQFLCSDMYEGFISLAKIFPNAKVCIDNFHVIQRLNQSISEVRRRHQNSFLDQNDMDSYKLLKGIRHKLTVREDRQQQKWKHHTEANLAALARAFELVPELEECYRATQHFHEVNLSFPFSMQYEMFYEWYREYKATDVPELKTAVTTLYSKRSYIFNSWRYKRSNAVCEGFNNVVKDLKKSSYGLHDFETFRKRILLVSGRFTIDPDSLIISSKCRKGGQPL